MYLKTLKLSGFKSFADRTRLELRPGVTVVVGPNGSGKSNVVDALAWVMGTQSPKSLRTDSMDDVIFAGTATRPGLGRAEVTLVLDNGSRALPLDLPEVSITRRLYRDGSSDYEINGVGCRLLDIQELLSDSGVGRHQHVIIGQGQIDSVLNAGPQDHRAVIEEAAGILKHRVRKEKALRRLERTDGDVLRLKDLLGELARHMKPLERQAAAATRHDELRESVHALRLAAAGDQLRAMLARQQQSEAEDAALATDVARGEAEIGDLASVLGILRAAAAQVGEALDRDTAAAARIETTVERLRRITSVARERSRAARARLEGADERRRDLDAERSQLVEDAAGLAEAEQASRTAAEAAERRFRALEDEERSLADQEGMSTEGAVAVARGDLRSLEAAAARDERELESVERRLEALAAQLESDTGELERLRVEIQHIDAEAGAAQQRYAATTEARAAEQQGWERAESDNASARLAVAESRARIEALEQAAAGMADPDARAMCEQAQGSLGSWTSLLDIPEHLGAAVDAALAPWADAIGFSDATDLEAAVAAVKQAGRGGVPLVVGSPGAGSAADGLARTRRIAEAAGLELLLDLLGPDAARSAAAGHLADVVVAEGWAAGWRLVQEHPDLRVVTPEGDLITASGIRVAHPDGAGPAMLEAAHATLEQAEIAAARSASILVHAKRGFDDARRSEREALESLEAVEARLAGVTEALARLDRTVGSLRQEMARLEQRRASLLEALESMTTRREALVERLAALEGEEAERQRAWEELVRRREAVSEEKEAARDAWQEAAASLRAVDERRTMIDARLAAIDGAIDSELRRPVDPDVIERLEAVEATARRALEIIVAHLEVLRQRQSSQRSTAASTGSRLREVQLRHDRSTAAVGEARERRSALAVERAELRVRFEAVAESLRRDADATEDEALAAPRPEVPDGVDLVDELATREAELRRMGPVNPLAAQEYAELSERHGFLSAQLDDLERSRDELRKVVSALDDEIRERFAEAYDEVSAAYEEHFSVLFPGGRGRLRMSDPDDPLGSGVEIEAQPLGKKVAKMSLLSGGERSLAALAFLFAIFKARPSPFYVLDEVEAALDDANLRRFLSLLETFRGTAQLVVITHQQQTMEAADVLYGVTMEPGGSSKVVAKALPETAEIEEAAVH